MGLRGLWGGGERQWPVDTVNSGLHPALTSMIPPLTTSPPETLFPESRPHWGMARRERRRDSMGRFVKESAFPEWFWVAMAVLFIFIFLKGIGVVQSLTGIDPLGLSVNLDAGTLGLLVAVMGIFLQLNSVLRKLDTRLMKIEGRLDKIEERVAGVEAKGPRWGS